MAKHSKVRERAKLKVSISGFQVTPTDAAPRMIDLLRFGSKSEVRSALSWVGMKVESGEELPREVALWIGGALRKIGECNEKPDRALRLGGNNKIRYGVHYHVGLMSAVKRSEGGTKEDRLALIESLDLSSAGESSLSVKDDPADRHLERAKKRLYRHKKRTKT